MVLDEDALEAMLARGRKADSKPAEMVTTDETDEFEVYERQPTEEPEVPEPTPAPQAAPPQADEDFEVFERHPAPSAPVAEPEPQPEAPPQPMPEAAAEPTAQPAMEPPAPESAPRRPEVWPPITRREPAAPATPQEPTPEPPARTHAPEPAAQTAAPAAAPSGARIAILQATFNVELTDTMSELAKQKAAKLGAAVVAHETCPGVYDLPLPTKRLLARDDVDGVVVIGVVVQGETKHDEIITHATAKTLQELSLQFDKPVGLAITGPGMTWQQAEARVGNAAHGVEAVLALLAA